MRRRDRRTTTGMTVSDWYAEVPRTRSTTDWWLDDAEEEERRSRHNSIDEVDELSGASNETKPRSFSTRTESFRLDGEKYNLYGSTGTTGGRLRTQRLGPELIPEGDSNLDD